MGVGTVVGTAIGFMVGQPYIGFALGRSYDNHRSAQELRRDMSPRYSFGAVDMTSSHEIPVPVIYGEELVAGNIIYKKMYDEVNEDSYQRMDLQVALCEGPIESVSNIKVNDAVIPDLTHKLSFDPKGSTAPRHYKFYFTETGTAQWDVDFKVAPTRTGGPPYIRIEDKDGNEIVYQEGDIEGDLYQDYSGNFQVTEAMLGEAKIIVYRGGATHDWARPTLMLPTDHDAVRLGDRDQEPHEINPDEHFPYTAYISAHLDAEELELRGTPTITSIVRGRKVRVFNSASWGDYSVEWSRNPAWCLLDFITNRRYGLGIQEEYIDLASFVSSASYCDEEVTVEVGGEEVDIDNRFELDYVIDMRQSSLDIIQDILGTFQAYLIYSHGQLRLKIDKAEAPVQAFVFDPDDEHADDNIVADSFRYFKLRKADVPNRVIVQYVDPFEHWEILRAAYSDDDAIRQSGEVIEKELSLLGINRFLQAGRLAFFYWMKANFCGTFCEFRVGIDSLHCEAGDVITVTHPVPGWVEEASDKEFRIIEIYEDESDEMRLLCQEHHAEIYTDEGVTEQPGTPPVFPPPSEFPPHVRNLTLSEEDRVMKDGTQIPVLVAQWLRPPDYPHYHGAHVHYRRYNGEWSDWLHLGLTVDQRFEIWPVNEGLYEVRVVAVNRQGIRAPFATAPVAQIEIQGKTDFDIVAKWGEIKWTANTIHLNWEEITDPALVEYAVRLDPFFGCETGDEGNLIFQGRTLSEQPYSSWRLTRPRRPKYTLYLAARDKNDNWTTPQPITVWHPGITKLEAPIAEQYPSALQVHLPKVYDKYHLLTGEEKAPEELEKKEILGYVVRLEEINVPPEEDKIEKERWVPIADVEGAEVFKLPVGREFEVTVGAFDSVVHPIDPERPEEWDQENEDLYDATFSDPTTETVLAETTSTTLVIAANDSSRKGKAGADFTCDGEDDHVQINTAIELLMDAGIGGSVVLLEGTYVIDDSIRIQSNITIRGQGGNTLIKMNDGHDAQTPLIKAAELDKCHQYMTIRDLVLDGNRDNLGGSGITYGILLEGLAPIDFIKHVTISDLEVRNCTWEGIRFGQHTSHSKITNCEVHDCMGGIYITKDSIVSNCIIEDVLFGIMDMGDAADSIISDCIVLNASQVGMAFTSAVNTSVLNCVVKDSGGTGMFGGTEDNLFEGNKITGSGMYAMTVTGARTRIMANVFYDNDFGIWVREEFGEYTLISDNDLYGNTNGSIMDDGANTSFGAGNRISDGSWVTVLEEWDLEASYDEDDRVMHNGYFVCTFSHPAQEDREPGVDVVVADQLTTISVNGTDDRFEDSASGLTVFEIGSVITVSGFTNSDNNGKFTVLESTDSYIRVSESLTNESAGAEIDITAAVWKLYWDRL